MKEFHNKVALITGGNSGIGYATAMELKEQGASVIITGKRKEAVEIAAAELGVEALVADQSSLTAIQNLVTEVGEKFGSLDILFINAGVTTRSTIEAASEFHFDSIMNVNFKGAYFTLSRFIPLLKDGASVVFLSSNTASSTHAGSSVYSASKTALNSLMKTAAIELAPRKIRVNAVSPGPIETEILRKSGLDETELSGIYEMLTQKIPLHQIGNARDVAKMVAYLSGEAAGFITGSEILIDGGMVLA